MATNTRLAQKSGTSYGSRDEALAEAVRDELLASDTEVLKEAKSARLRDAWLEGGMAPAVQEPVKAGAWRMSGSGVQSRVNPARGVIEHVQNVGGSVKNWEEAYTPPPVDRKRSYGDALLTDLPKRVDLIRRNLLAGDIPAAEAERAEVEKYVDENRSVLHDYARYTGTDKVTAMASAKALDFATGAWLTDEDKLLFDPKNNPSAVKAWGARQGAVPDYVSLLEGANRGDPESLDIAQRINGMSSAAARGAQSERESLRSRAKEAYGNPAIADAAASLLPAAESPVSVGNRFSEYYNRAKTLVLAGMPEGVSGGTGVGEVLQPLFQAGDADVMGDGLARLVPSFAGVLSGDAPAVARGKLASASRKLAGYATMLGSEPEQRRLVLPVLESFMASSRAGGVIPTDAVMRGVLESGVAPVIMEAAAGGRVLDDAAVTALAGAELARRTGKADGSPLASELARADQFVSESNLRVTSPLGGPAPQMFNERGQAIPAGVYKDAMYPGFLAQKDALRRASLSAKAELASGRAKTFEGAFRATAVPALRDEFMMQSSQDAKVAGDMADTVVTYMLGKKGGVDLRTIKDDMARDWGATANQMAIMNAKEVLATGTKREKQGIYEAERKQLDTWAHMGREESAQNYDAKLHSVFNGAKNITDWDALPGYKVWNVTLAGVDKVTKSFVSDSVRSLGGAMGPLGVATVADLSTKDARGALSKKVADVLFADMVSRSSRITGKMSEARARELADVLAANLVDSARALKPVVDSIQTPAMRDARLASLYADPTAFSDALISNSRTLDESEAPVLASDQISGATDFTTGLPTVRYTSAQMAINAVAASFTGAIMSEAVGDFADMGHTAKGIGRWETVDVVRVMQPADTKGLAVKLGHYATTFVAAEHVEPVPTTPVSAAQGQPSQPTEDPTLAVSTIPAAFPGSALSTYGLSPSATREVQRAERARLTAAMGPTGGLVNAPVDALKPGDTLAKVINGLGEVQRNSTRASENAAAPAIMESLSRKLEKVSPEIAAGVNTTVVNLLGDMGDIPYREVQRFADRAVIAATRRQVERDMATYGEKKQIDAEWRVYLETERAKIKQKYPASSDSTGLTASGAAGIEEPAAP